MATITVLEAARMFGVNGEMHKQLKLALSKGMLSAALRAKQEIQTKAIVAASPPPIDKGLYRAGWQVKKLPMGAVLYNSTPYAAAIEYGVPAASVVVSKKFAAILSEWVTRKMGGLAPKDAKRAAWGIMNALKKKGIFNRGSGFRILEKFTKDRVPIIVREECEKEIRKAIK